MFVVLFYQQCTPVAMAVIRGIDPGHEVGRVEVEAADVLDQGEVVDTSTRCQRQKR